MDESCFQLLFFFVWKYFGTFDSKWEFIKWKEEKKKWKEAKPIAKNKTI